MSEVCRVIDVARSSVYYGKRRKSKSSITKEELHAVKSILEEQHHSFGRRVVHRLLKQRGIDITEYRISKIFKGIGHISKYGRRKCKNVNTSDNTKEYRKANLLPQISAEQKELLVIWHMDFTEVKTADGKIYCCGIIYNGKRILAGLETSKRCNGKFAVTTTEHAIARYGKPDIIHTDRGTQFLSKAFRDMMEREGITHSMSRPHKPCDNAPIETFWKSMKTEVGYTEDMTDEEMQMVTEYYGHYYNTLRPHSALGYLSPLAYINLKNVI